MIPQQSPFAQSYLMVTLGSSTTHMAELNLPTIPQAARKAHIFRDLQCDTLISVGVLCDSGLVATFTADDVKFFYGPHLVLQGKRNKVTKL